MSTANSVVSGLDCASPESIMDPTNLTPAGDQYSLGCVMYYCLTGRFPFPEGTAAEKMIAQQTREPESLQKLVPEIPAGLLAVVNKLMEKSPANRYATTGGTIEALRPLLGSGTSHSVSGFRPQPILDPRVAPSRPAVQESSRLSGLMPRPTLPSRESPIRELPTRPSVRTTVAAQASRAPAPAIPTRASVAPAAPAVSKTVPRPTPMPPSRVS